MRNSLKDFEVHKIRTDRVDKEPTAISDNLQHGEVGYAVGGKEIDPTENKSHCKTVTYGEGDETVSLYFIKIGIRGFMFDPWDSEHQVSAGSRFGRPAWAYHKVSKACFDHYYKFLQSRNKAWLRQAEREI